MNTTRLRFLGVLAGWAVLYPAASFAQNRQGEGDEDRHQERESDRYERGDEDDRRMSERDHRDDDDRRMYGRDGDRDFSEDMERRFDGDQTVAIGIDYDEDGRFDTFEYIMVADLEIARQNFDDRVRDDRFESRGNRDQDFRQNRRPQNEYRSERVQGEILSVDKLTMYGASQPHTLVRIKTDDGRTLRAELGPQQELSRLNLKQGDKIVLEGDRGRLNDRYVLFADKITSGSQTLTINRPQFGQMRRIEGEIVNTWTRNLSGQEHLLASVKNRRGDMRTVNFGPKSKVESLNLKNGETIVVLGSRSRIEGQDAFQVQQIRRNGQLHTITWEKTAQPTG